MKLSLAIVAGLALTRVAHADQFEDADKALQRPAPVAGVAKATVHGPTWCAGVEKKGEFSPEFLRMDFEQYYKNHYTDDLMKAAARLCSADAKNALVQHATAEILQQWMNALGLTEAEAVESISAHLHKDVLDAAKTQLCDQLVVSEEDDGAHTAELKEERKFFDCSHKNEFGSLLARFDVTATPDPIAVLSYLSNEAHETLQGQADWNRELQYIADQYDYATFDPSTAIKALEAPPYKGNQYARITVLETIGGYKLDKAAVEAKVKAKAKDADWNELLIAAPQRGIAAWQAAAAQHKEAIERGNALEEAALGPSAKAMAGCDAALHKDVAALLKGIKSHATVADVEHGVSENPVGGLLMSRFTLCMAADGDAMAARFIDAQLSRVRVLRGPRQAAVFAALDALGKIKEDRSKFPVESSKIPSIWAPRELEGRFGELSSKRSKDAFGFGVFKGKGVIKSATKTAGGVKVKFASDKHKENTYNCVDTSHIEQIRSDGRVIYAQKCTVTGTETVDYKEDDILVPTELAAGLAPGRLVEFEVARGKERLSFPVRIYSDKSGKSLAAWLGFEL